MSLQDISAVKFVMEKFLKGMNVPFRTTQSKTSPTVYIFFGKYKIRISDHHIPENRELNQISDFYITNLNDITNTQKRIEYKLKRSMR